MQQNNMLYQADDRLVHTLMTHCSFMVGNVMQLLRALISCISMASNTRLEKSSIRQAWRPKHLSVSGHHPCGSKILGAANEI